MNEGHCSNLLHIKELNNFKKDEKAERFKTDKQLESEMYFNSDEKETKKSRFFNYNSQNISQNLFWKEEIEDKNFFEQNNYEILKNETKEFFEENPLLIEKKQKGNLQIKDEKTDLSMENVLQSHVLKDNELMHSDKCSELGKKSVCLTQFCTLCEKKRGIYKHKHGPGCGHSIIQHKGHIDYIVEGILHYPHEKHCDDHGRIIFL